MLVHFAELVGLDGARAAAERYRNDPKADNHDMMTVMIDPQMEALDRKAKREHLRVVPVEQLLARAAVAVAGAHDCCWSTRGEERRLSWLQTSAIRTKGVSAGRAAGRSGALLDGVRSVIFSARRSMASASRCRIRSSF